ncbi:HalOD1 output domain-containing protein [Candidatus Halobonum tyrrellensis]|uniref:Halobacterial output domain-containing protein n=1 Tax=Candidatus Halobonum tyrrellensis G22 TaxID=1324957 RepID=V4IZU5_9EURY|nr:HalOD1 output domain-containing protein [Candidatus Halobonum tyrrellensis]ESP88677.1 hypothetical protein K933_07498 [Candidatus Halobonum tyrrellensis G22]
MSSRGSDRPDDGRSSDDPPGSTNEYRSPAAPSDEGVYGVEFDGETVYRTRFDPGVRDPSTIVLAMVAAVTGTPVEELEPLWPTIDLEALDRLFPARGGGGMSIEGSVHFRYEGTEVTVCDDGYVTVRAVDDSDRDWVSAGHDEE